VVGRKRHVLTDTLGWRLAVNVHPASVQDRDGAEALLREARRSFPFVERIIGDAGYQGQKMEAAVARTGLWELQIVHRCDRHRFVVLPEALDRGADPRLDQPLPTPRARVMDRCTFLLGLIGGKSWFAKKCALSQELGRNLF
jgi:transposase